MDPVTARWTADSGVALSDWLAGWEARVAGRPADRWVSSVGTEKRYDVRTYEEDLADRSAALRRLSVDWGAEVVDASVGADGLRLNATRWTVEPDHPPYEIVMGCGVTGSWSRPWDSDTRQPRP